MSLLRSKPVEVSPPPGADTSPGEHSGKAVLDPASHKIEAWGGTGATKVHERRNATPWASRVAATATQLEHAARPYSAARGKRRTSLGMQSASRTRVDTPPARVRRSQTVTASATDTDMRLKLIKNTAVRTRQRGFSNVLAAVGAANSAGGIEEEEDDEEEEDEHDDDDDDDEEEEDDDDRGDGGDDRGAAASAWSDFIDPDGTVKYRNSVTGEVTSKPPWLTAG